MRRNVVILFCIVGGMVFLVLSILNLTGTTERQQREPEKRLKTDSTLIDLSSFNEILSKEADILAVGVMASASCAGCSTNMLEYAAYVDSVESRFYDHNKIDKIFAVIGNVPDDATRFKKMYDLEEEVLFFPDGSDIANILSQWDNRLLNQWVFINTNDQRIFSRIMVLKAITPLPFKKDIVNRALFATEAENTTSNNP